MTQGPSQGPHDVPSLPDFGAGSSRPSAGGGRAPGGSSSAGPASGGGASPPPSGPRWGLILGLGGGGCLAVVAIVVVVALVLWWPAGAPEEIDDPAPTTTSEQSDRGGGEYIPSEPPDESAPPPEVTSTEAPSSLCTIHDTSSTTPQRDGWVSGGGLEFPLPDAWRAAGDSWGDQSAYMVDAATADQPVENGWYSLASVGAVEFPEEEGGYPGAEAAARALFQCDYTRDQAVELYGEQPQITDHRSEAITVDGQDAWIESGTLHLADPEDFTVTDAWTMVVIVVDTPDGPAAFVGGAATGMSSQVAELESMVDGLQLIG